MQLYLDSRNNIGDDNNNYNTNSDNNNNEKLRIVLKKHIVKTKKQND